MMKEILLAGLLFFLPTALFASNSAIEDYGNNQIWIEKLQNLQKNKQGKFRIIQLGDSHTAADFFTDVLRQRLQLAYGNGGIGWVYPAKVRGQRLATVSYSGADNWTVLTSRKDDSAHFPMGGILASLPSGSTGTIDARNLQRGTQTIQINAYVTQPGQSLIISDANQQMKSLPFKTKQGWQTLSVQANLPVEIHAPPGGIELGLINIENQQPGVVLSAMGINGAQFTEVNKWRPRWYDDLVAANPDLLILAYGTNEAFDRTLDVAQVESTWNQIIQRIKTRLPNTPILMIGAPESLIQNNGQCGVRSFMLDQVQQMQRRIAQKNRLMYWSWEQAMGGRCTMRSWSLSGLGRKDGVHFSAEGYQEAANILADQLIRTARNTQTKSAFQFSMSEPEAPRMVFTVDANNPSSVMTAYVPKPSYKKTPHIVSKNTVSKKKSRVTTEKSSSKKQVSSSQRTKKTVVSKKVSTKASTTQPKQRTTSVKKTTTHKASTKTTTTAKTTTKKAVATKTTIKTTASKTKKATTKKTAKK